MKKMMSEVMSDALKGKIILELASIFKSWGINEIKVEFDTLKFFTVIIPFNQKTKFSQAYHPDMLEDLEKKGYPISQVYADMNNGQKMYGMVKKQV